MTKRCSPRTQVIRNGTQIAFILILLVIAWQFMNYVAWLDGGGLGEPPRRPPGAEGFLPIASLMSLLYWFKTGVVHMAHPAGLYLFIAFVLMSWVAGKSFCSWVCPVGFLSETLEAVHRKIFKKRRLSLPRWLDYPLRSLKYLILGFFLLGILGMSAQALLSYLDSPYHALADVKMYRFFAHISPFALNTILILLGLSLIVPYFWCRYLCPYGALFGLLNWLSPTRISRSDSTCTDCQACTRICPARIPIHKLQTVQSDECTSCYQCVDACPVKATLEIRTRPGKRMVAPQVMGWIIIGIYVVVTATALILGHWYTDITPAEALQAYPGIDTYLHTN